MSLSYMSTLYYSTNMRKEMIEYKSFYKAFCEIINGLELKEGMWKEIEAMPFKHFLDFDEKIVVDNTIINDTCGR